MTDSSWYSWVDDSTPEYKCNSLWYLYIIHFYYILWHADACKGINSDQDHLSLTFKKFQYVVGPFDRDWCEYVQFYSNIGVFVW